MNRCEAAAIARSCRKIKHGRTGTREFKSWQCMNQRCHNPHSDQYERYGARGIFVCSKWRESFEAFFLDMGACPPGHTIDRIDGSKGYEPTNCRWSDAVTQLLNRDVTAYITAFGKTKTRYQWALELGVHYGVIAQRLRHGWTPEDSVSISKQKYRRNK